MTIPAERTNDDVEMGEGGEVTGVDEVEIGDGVEDQLPETEAGGKRAGVSKRSKKRARSDFAVHMSQHSELAQLDVLRRLCVRLSAAKKPVLGVEIDSKKNNSCSTLTKRQIRWAIDKILEEAKRKKSLDCWIAAIVKEAIMALKEKLGMYVM